MNYICQKCGAEVSEDALFCSKCGAKVSALRCHQCGRRLLEDSAFCTYCGTKLAIEQAPQQKTEVVLPKPVSQPVVQQEQEQISPVGAKGANPPDISPKESYSEETIAVSLEHEVPNEQAPEFNIDMEHSIAPGESNGDDQNTALKEFHLTRRKYTGYIPSLEKTDVVVSADEISIIDHNVNFLGGSKPEEKRSINIADLRAISVCREVSVLWLCLSLLVTISDLLLIIGESSGFKIAFILLAIVSWLMVWRQKITFYCNDGQKIAIRGREKAVMLELQKDLLSRIEAEPKYTGDLSDIVVKKTQYYLPEFEKAKRNEKCCFNWAAFFFNGIFAYYRKSSEIFWRYCKWPIIIYAFVLLGITGSSVIVFQNPDRIVGWAIIACILGTLATIYMGIAAIRFGKNFNAEYYQHCLICAESCEVTPHTVGTSVKSAILYWLVMTVCCIVLSIIVSGLLSLSILGGVSDLWNDDNISETEITEEALIGRWNIVSVESDGVIYSVDSAIEAGASRTDAEAIFSQNYFTFYNDGSFELHLYDGSVHDVTSGTWALQDSLLIIVDENNNPDVILLHMDGEYLLIDSETEGIIKLEKVFSNSKTQEDILEPSNSENIQTTLPEKTPADSNETRNDQSQWGYEDYVAYYGFDPADYGYVWYNEMRGGPLDEFFEFVYQELASAENHSRLYSISDPYNANLTPDDFVGTWETDNGLVFTIDNMGGQYSIDLSANENLGVLGGWFSENIYNIYGNFCGMAGYNGVTSFYVSYQYSSDYPVSSWLSVEIENSRGDTITDIVTLDTNVYG